MAGMTLSDFLRVELERTIQQVTPGELRERLSVMPPLAVRESPARALRQERDRR